MMSAKGAGGARIAFSLGKDGDAPLAVPEVLVSYSDSVEWIPKIHERLRCSHRWVPGVGRDGNVE
jgi:hypothetical protein